MVSKEERVFRYIIVEESPTYTIPFICSAPHFGVIEPITHQMNSWPSSLP